jgi:hypothetical protein
MASISSNGTETLVRLGKVAGALNFRNRTAGSRRLGDELLDTTAVAIKHRTRDQGLSPDGAPLAKLSRAYLARKFREGHDGRILVRTGEMTDTQQLLGETSVGSNRAQMTAGLDEETRDKVEWAEEGSANRPKRPFYDLGEDGMRLIEGVLGEAIDRAAR